MGKKGTNIKPASASKPEPPPAPPSRRRWYSVLAKTKQVGTIDFEELLDRLKKNNKFSTYDLRKAKTFHNRVQTFNQPIGSMDNNDGKPDAISILLQGIFPEGYEIWLYADGTWKLR